MTYVLWTMRYRNFAAQQAELEILDRGNEQLNQEAAQALGEAWCEGQTVKTMQLHRLIEVRPMCVATERPVEKAEPAIKPIVVESKAESKVAART